MRKEVAMALALLGLCAVIRFNNPDFTSPTNITNVTRRIPQIGVIAIGAGIVIISGGIDLSVGSIMALSAVLVARLCAPTSLGGAANPLWIGITVALVVSVFAGLLQGLLITRLGLQPFIVTLAGMLCFRGVAQTITEGGNITITDDFFRGLRDRGLPLSPDGNLVLTAPLILFLLLATAFAYLLHFTVFGRHVFAIGGNRDAARYSGVPVRGVETAVYVLSATLAGVAGVLYAADVGGVSATAGNTFELKAIAASVLGGCSLRGGEGSLAGVVIGVTLFTVLDNGINMLQPIIDAAVASDSLPWALRIILPKKWRLDNSQEIIIGAVILSAVLLDQATMAWRDRRRREGK